MSVRVTINGEQRSLDLDPEMPLLWVLRDECALTGTKYGCGIAQCGACTVHVDGQPRRACVTPLQAVSDLDVTTIEALNSPQGEAVRAAWRALDVPQCGYCQSGQIMAAAALLAETPEPSDEQIDQAMAGNICRCATYHRIRQAIHRAAAALGRESA